MFKKISSKMTDAVYDKTADQCNSKIRKLKLEYRKIKDSRNKTGTERKEWKFFDAMDAVLGHKPAIEPPVVVESGAEATTSTAADNREDDVDEETGTEDLGASKSDEQETSSRSENITCRYIIM